MLKEYEVYRLGQNKVNKDFVLFIGKAIAKTPDDAIGIAQDEWSYEHFVYTGANREEIAGKEEDFLDAVFITQDVIEQ